MTSNEPRRRHQGFDAPSSLLAADSSIHHDPNANHSSMLPSNYLDTSDLLSDEAWASQSSHYQYQQHGSHPHPIAHSAPANNQHHHTPIYPYQQRTQYHQMPLQSVPSGMVPEDIVMRDWSETLPAPPPAPNFPSAGESMRGYVSARDCLTPPEHDYHSLGLAVKDDDHFQQFLDAAAASASPNGRRPSASMTASQRSASGSTRDDDSPPSLSGTSLSTCGTPATSISIASPKNFSQAGSLPRSSSLSSRQHARHRSSVSSVSQVLERSSSRARASTTTVNLQGAPIVGSPSQEGGKVPTQRSRPSRRASVGPAAQAAALSVANALPGSGLRIDASGASAVIGPTGARRSGPLSARVLPTNSFAEEHRGRAPLAWGSIPVAHHPQAGLSDASPADAYSAGTGLQSPGLATSTLGTSPLQASSFHDSMHRLHLQSPPLDNNVQLHHFSQPQHHGVSAFADLMDTSHHQVEQQQSNAAYPSYKQDDFVLENFFDETGGAGTETAQQQQQQQHISADSTRNNSAVELHASLSVSPTPVNDSDTAPTSGRASAGPASVSAHDDSQTGHSPTVVGSETKGAPKPAKAKTAQQAKKGSLQAASSPSKPHAAKLEDDDVDDWVADRAADDDEEDSVKKGKGGRVELSVAEKRRRRRESHNAVERRRRDHINERITELAGLLPESMLLEAIAASKQGGYDQFNPAAAIEAIAAASAIREAAEAANYSQSPTSSDARGSDPRRLMTSEQRTYAHSLAPVAADSAALAAAQARPNKGIILQKTCEYVQTLQGFLTNVMKTNAELEEKLHALTGASVSGGLDVANPHHQDSINRSLNVGVKVEPLSPVLRRPSLQGRCEPSAGVGPSPQEVDMDQRA